MKYIKLFEDIDFKEDWEDEPGFDLLSHVGTLDDLNNNIFRKFIKVHQTDWKSFCKLLMEHRVRWGDGDSPCETKMKNRDGYYYVCIMNNDSVGRQPMSSFYSIKGLIMLYTTDIKSEKNLEEIIEFTGNVDENIKPFDFQDDLEESDKPLEIMKYIKLFEDIDFKEDWEDEPSFNLLDYIGTSDDLNNSRFRKFIKVHPNDWKSFCKLLKEYGVRWGNGDSPCVTKMTDQDGYYYVCISNSIDSSNYPVKGLIMLYSDDIDYEPNLEEIIEFIGNIDENIKPFDFEEEWEEKDSSDINCPGHLDPEKDTRRLFGEGGKFKTKFPGEKGRYSLGYLEDLSEWVFYHDNISDEEKLKNLKLFDKMAREMLDKLFKGNFEYENSWLELQKKNMGK